MTKTEFCGNTEMLLDEAWGLMGLELKAQSSNEFISPQQKGGRMILLSDNEIQNAWPNEVATTTNALTQDTIEKELLRCARLVAKAQLDKAEPLIRQEVVGEIESYLIKARGQLQDKKEAHKKNKPEDIQSFINIGGKINAFQEVIDKLQTLKATVGKEG